jgi:hypothetical protein
MYVSLGARVRGTLYTPGFSGTDSRATLLNWSKKKHRGKNSLGTADLYKNKKIQFET